MKALVLAVLVAAARCRPTTVVSFSPVGYSPGVAPGFAYAFSAADASPVARGAAGRSLAAAAAAPPVVKTQYHSQDQLGQYAYGYVGAASTAHQVRTLDGAVRGSYTYLDARGTLQTATYVADQHGFRVEATNLPHTRTGPPPPARPRPVDPTPEVQAATAAHLRAVEEVRAARRSKAAAEAAANAAAEAAADAIHTAGDAAADASQVALGGSQVAPETNHVALDMSQVPA